MNQNVILFVLASIGRTEAMMQNSEQAYNELLQQNETLRQEIARLGAELAEAKKAKE